MLGFSLYFLWSECPGHFFVFTQLLELGQNRQDHIIFSTRKRANMTHGELNRLAVLSAINETPNHGYALHDQLKKESFYKIAAPTLYLLLRTMEDEGVIESFWDMPEKGTRARRIYNLTPAGLDHLVNERKVLHEYILQFKRLLDRIPRS
jgi:DNA-binding PadR family transcriptional regulator